MAYSDHTLFYLPNTEQEDDDSDKETGNWEATMIIVTNIPEGTSQEALKLFFENRWKSGGGSVEDIEYDPDTKSAVITFEERKAVKRVIEKLPILFNGVQIGIEVFLPDEIIEDVSEEAGEDSENIRGVEVRGVSSKTSEDTVMMYFENTRRSGGGDIKSMKSEDGVFYIIFEDEQVIERVLKKQHKCLGTAIEVCQYNQSPSPKQLPNKDLLVENINKETTKDFLYAETNVTFVSSNYGKRDYTAQVTQEEDLVRDGSDLAMSQHYVNCQMCGSYSEFYCNECHQEMCGECRDKHLRHPDNSEHEVCRYEDRKLIFPSIPCKLHPKHQLTLCCENCQQAICALCTTKKHAGHVFLDLEEVYTKKCKTHIELICKIRDDVLPKSRRLLHESMDATLEIKGNLEMLRSSMKEQASQIKELVDAILTENLDDLQSYETSAVKKLENQEKVLFTYVTQMQLMLEGYQNSRPSENPLEFLFDMNDILKVKLEPIPGVPKISLGNFFHGKLNNEEIRKQFGVLTKPTNET